MTPYRLDDEKKFVSEFFTVRGKKYQTAIIDDHDFGARLVGLVPIPTVKKVQAGALYMNMFVGVKAQSSKAKK